jgi:hypothetical protein
VNVHPSTSSALLMKLAKPGGLRPICQSDHGKRNRLFPFALQHEACPIIRSFPALLL